MAVRGGLLSMDACSRYRLSREECLARLSGKGVQELQR
jgi:hypothetical protein